VASHEDQEDSQSYYFEHNDEDEEELKEAYKVLYRKFLMLTEICQQHVHELNSLQIEEFLTTQDSRSRGEIVGDTTTVGGGH
jgi:hypothetical protein